MLTINYVIIQITMILLQDKQLTQYLKEHRLETRRKIFIIKI
jgi:hypothetical protein